MQATYQSSKHNLWLEKPVNILFIAIMKRKIFTKLSAVQSICIRKYNLMISSISYFRVNIDAFKPFELCFAKTVMSQLISLTFEQLKGFDKRFVFDRF